MPVSQSTTVSARKKGLRCKMADLRKNFSVLRVAGLISPLGSGTFHAE
jgi:hypothetical protein